MHIYSSYLSFSDSINSVSFFRYTTFIHTIYIYMSLLAEDQVYVYVCLLAYHFFFFFCIEYTICQTLHYTWCKIHCFMMKKKGFEERSFFFYPFLLFWLNASQQQYTSWIQSFFRTSAIRRCVCACASNLFLFYFAFFSIVIVLPTDLYVCVSSSASHLSSSEHTGNVRKKD